MLQQTAPTVIYTLSLHDALPICPQLSRKSCHLPGRRGVGGRKRQASRKTPRKVSSCSAYLPLFFARLSFPSTHSSTDRKSTRLNSSHEWISYAVFCLKKKK